MIVQIRVAHDPWANMDTIYMRAAARAYSTSAFHNSYIGFRSSV